MMNTNAEMDVPLQTGQIDGGKKQVLGNCPKCQSPVTSWHGVVRCTKWSCDFIEGLKEFIEGNHLARIAEEATIEQNLANIIKEERRREIQIAKPIRLGLLDRILRR